MRAEDFCYHAHFFGSGNSVLPALEKLEDELLRLLPRAEQVVVEMDDGAGPWHEEDLWDEDSDFDDFHEYDDDWNEMEAEAVFWHFM
eukprot:gene8108-8301_t